MRIYFFSIFLFFVLVGCQTKQIETIIPDPIVESQPSWDGEQQNSGLIDYIDGKGFLITKGAAERYTFLTAKFGKELTPEIEPGEGLIPEGVNFILSPEYMEVFMEVSRRNKSK